MTFINIFTALFIALPMSMGTPMETPSVQAPPLGACAYEDGNPDGTPCVWTDPDTGTTYLVDSTNYREA